MLAARAGVVMGRVCGLYSGGGWSCKTIITQHEDDDTTHTQYWTSLLAFHLLFMQGLALDSDSASCPYPVRSLLLLASSRHIADIRPPSCV